MTPEARTFNRRLGVYLASALRRRGWVLHKYTDGTTHAFAVHPSGFEVDWAILRDLFIVLVGARP